MYDVKLSRGHNFTLFSHNGVSSWCCNRDANAWNEQQGHALIKPRTHITGKVDFPDLRFYVGWLLE
jgi:hypothetical protein